MFRQPRLRGRPQNRKEIKKAEYFKPYKLSKLKRWIQYPRMNKVSVFWNFLAAQRFPDICDSRFENTDIQFKPDSHNVAEHLVWFGLAMME